MPARKQRQWRRVMSQLRKQYGERPVVAYNRLTFTPNFVSGVVAETEEYAEVSAVILPAEATRNFVYDLTQIAANKEFVTGGHFDAEDAVILFSHRALPATFGPLDNSTEFTFDGRRWRVTKITRWQNSEIYKIAVKHLQGVVPRITHIVSVLHPIVLTSTVT